MNYRRKKISMKERLEAAIEEAASRCKVKRSCQKLRKKRLREIELGAPGLRKPHGQSNRRNGIGRV
jgi:hypothetical protein